jgi:hypothetical protein
VVINPQCIKFRKWYGAGAARSRAILAEPAPAITFFLQPRVDKKKRISEPVQYNYLVFLWDNIIFLKLKKKNYSNSFALLSAKFLENIQDLRHYFSSLKQKVKKVVQKSFLSSSHLFYP